VNVVGPTQLSLGTKDETDESGALAPLGARQSWGLLTVAAVVLMHDVIREGVRIVNVNANANETCGAKSLQPFGAEISAYEELVAAGKKSPEEGRVRRPEEEDLPLLQRGLVKTQPSGNAIEENATGIFLYQQRLLATSNVTMSARD
jgi:hypothetical protein